jgi:hypothetical protein
MVRTISVNPGRTLEFDGAREAAREQAQRFLADPMIMSWQDLRTGRHSPNVSCCGNDDKEAWEIYAESRGGTLRVEVGDDYVFIFREGSLER